MASKLSRSPQIWKLASDLGIKNSNDPVTDILTFCHKKIQGFMKEYPDCKTLTALLEWVASCLGTSFEEVYCYDDLEAIKLKYVQQGEKIFCALESLLTEEVCGVTIKKANAEPWEGQYVSIIDCRGMKERKAYYTKWHELGHLLILTNQMRLSFTRTLHLSYKDPEEILVDVIAGTFGYFNPLVLPHLRDHLSFDEIERLTSTLCPESSYQAASIGFIKASPKPAILVICQLGLRRSEQRMLVQQRSFWEPTPVPKLRAVMVTPNDSARKMGFTIYENMRVPERSVIQLVHNSEHVCAEAEEDMSWWESSDGKVLQSLPVLVQAKLIGSDVYGIFTPI